MAAGRWCIRRFRYERQREVLFRAEDDRRCPRCAAHGAGARGDPVARRRHPQQRLHPLHAGDVRGVDLAQRAGLPVEIMLLPLWSPFHLNRISYWARTTIVPLMVLAALKPRAKNVSGVGIDELFLQEPHSIGMTAKAPHQSLGLVYPVSRPRHRAAGGRAVVSEKVTRPRDRAAVAFVEERLNGEDGWARSTRRWPMP